MPKPLRSADPGPPKNVQFAHFGVLNDGAQSKTSTVTSLVLNLCIAFVIIVVGAASRKSIEKKMLLTELAAPIPIQKVEPIKPKIVPPKPLPKLPDVPKLVVEQPKIITPQVKLPDVPKPPDVKMDQPKPVLLPPAPKQVVAMAAPVAVNLAHPQAASVVNNDQHPSAVRLGSQDSPVSNLKGPAVASVNLARGMPGMNSANTGNGPAASKVVLGNGSPEGTTIKGNGVVAVVGLGHGVPGGTGTAPARAGQVNLGQVTPPPMPKAAAASAPAQHPSPKVLYKPKPEYTAEAMQLHVEGTVSVRIRVMPDGSVEILGVTSGLGHGLDESAKRAVQATKFEPATDASGRPVVWDGVVNVAFQLAG
jgi:protein TonB